jgi:rfaE bifunctional protein nucleotidyltransferase chain/domain
VAAGGAASIGFPAAAQASSSDGFDDANPHMVIERVRARGGTVVATGGCFDLLHPGHIQTLHSARALGDCLVVCLNSDRSVRRLKGPTRPIVPSEDRAAVLSALGCVDAVVIFDEDTPAAVLRELRPHVWVKGGDYAVVDLPEAEVLAAWGGRAVVLPFVEGRSTTRLIQEATLHAV